MDKKPKILIATGLFPPQAGGPATYSKLLLDKLPERGFEVQIQSFGMVLGYPKILRHLVYFSKVAFAALSVDVVYAQDPVSVGLPALAAARLAGKKFYLKIVGDYAWEQGTQRFGVVDLLDDFSREHDKYRWQIRWMKNIQAFVANHADRIVVPSKYLKQIVSNWGVNPEKIHVIYNAFNPPNIHKNKEDLRREFEWQDKIVLSAGRLVPWKGFDTLISIWPDIIERMPETTLFIAGDGPDARRLKRLVQESAAKHCIKLLGKVDQEVLFERVKAADLFVLNTSYEGLSHQLLEVMALETPIITTRSGGNMETIEDRESGILVRYNDREALKSNILALLGDEERRRNLASKARERLDRFNEGRMLEEISNFLRG